MKNIFSLVNCKLKPWKATFACLLLLTATTSMTWAQTQADGSYRLQNDDVIINANGFITTFYDTANWNMYLMNSTDSTLIIPNTLHGQPVKGIVDADPGIFERQKIKSLQLPQTIKVIGSNAFQNNSLTSVDFSGLNNLTTIGNSAFYQNSLDSVDLSSLNALTTIGQTAFANQNDNDDNGDSLTRFVLPPGIDGFLYKWKSSNDTLYSGDTVDSLGIAYNRQTPDSSYQVTFTVSDERVVVSGAVITLGKTYGTKITNQSGQAVFDSIYVSDLAATGDTLQPATLFYIITVNGIILKSDSITVLNADIDVVINLMSYTIQDEDVEIDTDGFITTFYDTVNWNNYLASDTSNSTLVIPDTLNGQQVKGIVDSDHGIFESQQIKSLQLPQTIEVIGNFAFSSNSITSLDFSGLNNLTTIGTGAFSSNSITSLDFSGLNNLTMIRQAAFFNNSLNSVDFSGLNNLTTIGEYAFDEQTGSLTSFVLPTPNNIQGRSFLHWKSSSGDTINRGGTINNFMPSYFAIFDGGAYQLTDDDVVVSENIIRSTSYNFAIKDIIIPDTLDNQEVIGIANDVFREKYLLSIQLPTSLKNIGNWAFYRNLLDSMDFSDLNALTNIGDYAFSSNSITSLDLSGLNNLTTIGNSAFSSNNLTSVDFSELNALTIIGEGAFSSNALNSLDLSGLNNLTTIENSAFYQNSLDSVNFSGLTALTTIGRGAFFDNSLNSVDLSDLNALTTIGNSAFQQNSLNSVDLSGLNALTNIGEQAFSSNALTSLNLSNCTALKTIGEGAFASNNLTSVDFSELSALTIIGEGAFDNNSLDSLDFSELNNLTTIGGYAFWDQKGSLTNFVLPPQVDGVVFKWTTENNSFYSGNTVTDFTQTYNRQYPDSSYQVIFNVSDRGMAVSGAVITLGKIYGVDTTNQNGQAVFDSVYVSDLAATRGTLQPASIPYTLIREGDTVKTGSIAVSNADLTLNISLNPYYTATFIVVDNVADTPVAATIILNEKTLTGDSVVFDSLEAGSYQYNVSFQGYMTKIDSITITDVDVSETVSLTPITDTTTNPIDTTTNPIDTTTNPVDTTMVTGIAADVEFQIFPNPAQQSITITGATGLEVSFYDLTGRRVKYIPHLQENTQVNLSGWATGIYTITVAGRTKKLIVR